VEAYSSEFNNLSIRVGLDETNEQLTVRYLLGLSSLVQDEIGVVRLTNLEDAGQLAL
jgi:hypothetical protein